MTRPTHDARPRAAWTPSSAKPPLASRLMRASWRGLPAARHKVGVERGLTVPAADGSPLLTDHYFPRAGGDFPTLLVRTPYGRGVPWSPQYGILFAEQGFHVVVQSCRGTGGSGGRFHLWRNEPADGLAAVGWLREQPWFDGRLGTVGPSYLGYVQWALALDPPPELKAMVVQVGLHDPYALFHADGVLNLETALAVGAGMTYQHRGMGAFLRATLRLQRRLRSAVTARPLRGAYADALGGEIPWLDEVMAHPDADDPYWEGASLAMAAEGAAAGAAVVPTALVTGRHDALVDQTFAQYDRLRRAGGEVSLLVGPWTHTSALQAGWAEVFTESLAWLRAHLCDDPSGLRPTPVRVHVGGAEAGVRDLDAWPPEASTASWYPTADGHLTHEAPTDTAPVASFRHDPDEPVPTLGGALLSRTAGERDNASLEARADVFTFTGPALDGPLTVLGPVSARISASTDTGHGEVFVRLCDVDPEGRSVNVCDGLARLRTTGADPVRVTIPMTPTAHRFAPGHRVRWQVGPAPHPRYALNPGTGESRIDATEFVPVRVTVHADSELTLTVVED
ncbi:peptidase S15 [Streptomyces sp. CB01249]|uniref:CocE/NonD family hydrolase n=1 Tax=Streptomyces sp. CB01249 TaxID=1703929 RepID=UPI00093F916B|nr:CocE/NonD family hydrolase [Streptomyces sp. CB01249]OKJ01526.1 peptidase S15 [Streptomyces sp. CB01249]